MAQEEEAQLPGQGSSQASIRAPLPAAGFSTSTVLPSEQGKLLESLPDTMLALEEQKQQADWLKSLLPSLCGGWWDVAANGKGFIIKQRWREHGQQTQTYPRVGREHYFTLKEKDIERAKEIIEDRIIGHIEDCLASPKADRRWRAGCAAKRLGIEH